MSSLTALTLERERETARIATMAPAKRPALVLEWRVDPQFGRAVAAWTVAPPTMAPSVLSDPAFGW